GPARCSLGEGGPAAAVPVLFSRGRRGPPVRRAGDVLPARQKNHSRHGGCRAAAVSHRGGAGAGPRDVGPRARRGPGRRGGTVISPSARGSVVVAARSPCEAVASRA